MRPDAVRAVDAPDLVAGRAHLARAHRGAPAPPSRWAAAAARRRQGRAPGSCSSTSTSWPGARKQRGHGRATGAAPDDADLHRRGRYRGYDCLPSGRVLPAPHHRPSPGPAAHDRGRHRRHHRYRVPALARPPRGGGAGRRHRVRVRGRGRRLGAGHACSPRGATTGSSSPRDTSTTIAGTPCERAADRDVVTIPSGTVAAFPTDAFVVRGPSRVTSRSSPATATAAASATSG